MIDDGNDTGVRKVGTGRESRKSSAASKVFRATTALTVFVIPMMVGASALIGCGLYRLFKREKPAD